MLKPYLLHVFFVDSKYIVSHYAVSFLCCVGNLLGLPSRIATAYGVIEPISVFFRLHLHTQEVSISKRACLILLLAA